MNKPGTIASQVVLGIKNPPANSGDIRRADWIPGLERFPGEGTGKPVQYSCLGNSMDRGAWRAAVHGVTMSRTLLSSYTHTHTHTHTQSLYGHHTHIHIHIDNHFMATTHTHTRARAHTHTRTHTHTKLTSRSPTECSLFCSGLSVYFQ